jgi:hypothetical protein
VKFLLDDKPLQKDIPPQLALLHERVSKLPDGKLYRTKKLMEIIGMSFSQCHHQMSNDILKPFKYIPNTKLYWGNAKTIKEFIKYNEQESE